MKEEVSASTYDHSLETQFTLGVACGYKYLVTGYEAHRAVIISTSIVANWLWTSTRGLTTYKEDRRGFVLTILIYLPIISANCGARLVCKGSLTPDAICNTHTPALEVFTETMSSSGRVSKIIRSPLDVRLIKRSSW